MKKMFSKNAPAKNVDNDLQNDLQCPITGELFLDPVLLVGDGHTYEREALQQWFDQGKDTSPMTGTKLTDKTMAPNFMIRSRADEVRGSVPKGRTSVSVPEKQTFPPMSPPVPQSGMSSMPNHAVIPQQMVIQMSGAAGAPVIPAQPMWHIIDTQDIEGTWCCCFLPMCWGAIFTKKATGPDTLNHSGCTICPPCIPFSEDRVRIPGTNSFRKADGTEPQNIDVYTSTTSSKNGGSCSFRL